MKLEREEVSQNLREFISIGSGVLVGAPGVGKTHLLKEYCTRVLDEGGTCLYLPLDKLGANSEVELQAELDLPTDLPSYLLSEEQTSPSNTPPVLVIDAFDAARSESAQQFVLRLIRGAQQRLTNRWRIVVSVRSYDARKSSALQALFPETSRNASRYRDASIRCRHFYVPPLTAGEVHEAVASIPALPAVYDNASDRFKALMTVPFNLWLAESLLKDQGTATSLSDVNSEVQLLTLFWFHRVENTADSEAKSVLLTRITERMVSERTLAVRIADVYPLDGTSVWDALLSSEVLDRDAQRDRKRISFSHNILFDFAVSVLMIDDQPEAAAAFLAEDPSRPLFLRPSVDYFFTRLWDAAPTQFWNVLWYMLEASEQHVRIYARLVPAMVMAREGRVITQFQPLLDRLQGDDAVAPQALLNLLQTVRGVFNGRRDRLWAELMRRTAARLRPLFAWELGALTFDIFERAVVVGDTAVIDACGEVGRQLLNWALEVRVKNPTHYSDRIGANWGVRLVARTFARNVQISRTLLAEVVAQVARPEFPIEYFSRLTDEVKHLWSIDPDFAAAVYEAAFSHHEKSDEKTSFGTPILPLTSTRRQDFSMCQFHLIEDYGKFLQQVPPSAIRAALRALNGYIIDRHVLRFLNPGYTVADVTTTFPFRGRDASYVQDLSYSWDASLHRDQPIKLADELFTHLDEVAQHGDVVQLDSALDIFAEEARAAFWWKRLLETGSKHPEVFATRLFEMAVATPVIECSETLQAAGSFIEQSSRYLTVDQRTRLETQILQLSADGEDEKKVLARTRWRNRLLSRFPSDLVVTDEARGIRAELEQKGQLEPNEPLVRYSITSGTYTEDRFLEDKGVDPTREDNKRLRTIIEPLEVFSAHWRNARPDADAVTKILPLLTAAFEAIQIDTTSDPPVKQLAWTKITSAAQAVVRADIRADGAAFALCKQILLAGLETVATTDSAPETDVSMDAQLESDSSTGSRSTSRDRDETYTFASWSPDPITNAAEALPWLGRLTRDEEILAAIETLSRHAEPSVRFLVVRELFRVLGTAPDVFWKIAEERAATERNVVVQDSLVRTLGDVIGKNEERVVSVLTVIADRLFPADKESEVLNTLTSIVMWLNLSRESTWAIGWTDAFLKDPVAHSHALQHAVFETVQRYVHPAEVGRRTEVFKRAVEWLSRAIDAAMKAMDVVEQKAGSEFDEPTAELYKRLYGVLHEVVLRVQLSFRRTSEEGTDAQRVEFYWHVKPLLQQVVRLGGSPKRAASIFAPTAHHFIEFLGDAVEHDPAGALQLAAAVASASEAAGYNLDSMAAKETVALAERIVTDYRSELRRPEVLSDLVRLLDLFAKAGWPDALRLLWRLDEVFR